MNTFTAIVERDSDTGLYVGWVPGLPGAHSHGSTPSELLANLLEVLQMLVENGSQPLTVRLNPQYDRRTNLSH